MEVIRPFPLLAKDLYFYSQPHPASNLMSRRRVRMMLAHTVIN